MLRVGRRIHVTVLCINVKKWECKEKNKCMCFLPLVSLEAATVRVNMEKKQKPNNFKSTCKMRGYVFLYVYVCVCTRLWMQLIIRTLGNNYAIIFAYTPAAQ